MSGILAHCLDYRKVCLKTLGDYPTEISLSKDQYVELLSCDVLLAHPSPPPPPMVEETLETSSSILGGVRTIKKRRYDYQDPTYLKAKDDFLEYSEQFRKDYPNGKIYGMKVNLI